MDLTQSQAGEVGGGRGVGRWGEDPQELSGHSDVQIFIQRALRTPGGFRSGPHDTGCGESETRKNNVASSLGETDKGHLAPDGAGHPGELKRGLIRSGERGFGKRQPQAGCFPM